MPVLCTSHQAEVMHSAVHLRSAAQVRSSSWVAVPAVTVPIDHGRVLKIQLAIQAPRIAMHYETEGIVPKIRDLARQIVNVSSLHGFSLSGSSAAAFLRSRSTSARLIAIGPP